jgi:glycosyltransferase involved in cell wall biosynthesis
MKSVKVTVLMSVYNGERFLREAVESILAQTMPDFEFIIINDGSTDATAKILASYDDPRIRIVHQENMGVSVSVNRGLEMSRTELVARLDADDIALPNRLEVQLEEYERLARPDVLGGHVKFISESGYSLGTREYPLKHQDIVDRLEKGGGTAIINSTVLYKRDSVLQCGGYDPFFRYSTEDYDLWLRMSRNYRFANTKHIVGKYRINKSGIDSQVVRQILPSRTSNSWYHCVAKQRHLLEKEGAGYIWDDLETRERILDHLWPRFIKCGCHQSVLVNRSLAHIRADLKSPGQRWRGLLSAARLYAHRPIATTKYIFMRRRSEPQYLVAEEVVNDLNTTFQKN